MKYFKKAEILFVKINKILPTRYTFVYSVTVNVWSSEDDEDFEHNFRISLSDELLFAQGIIKVLEKVIVGKRKVWGIR